jgi:hypothetical protein
MVFFVIHTFHYLTHSQLHIVTVNSDNFIISGKQTEETTRIDNPESLENIHGNLIN